MTSFPRKKDRFVMIFNVVNRPGLGHLLGRFTRRVNHDANSTYMETKLIEVASKEASIS